MCSNASGLISSPCLLQNLKDKIDGQYRIRLILDNLPITTYDLEDQPESIRPGFEVGYKNDEGYFVNNHLMFKILVHQTNGQYTRARQDLAEIEAAAVVEVSTQLTEAASVLCTPCCVAACMPVGGC